MCPSLQVTTDVKGFESRYRKGLNLEREGQSEQAAVEYERALELNRNDYPIEDLYEDWTTVERERLSNACVDTLGRLAAYYFDARKTQECVEVCYRTLDKDY